MGPFRPSVFCPWRQKVCWTTGWSYFSPHDLQDPGWVLYCPGAHVTQFTHSYCCHHWVPPTVCGGSRWLPASTVNHKWTDDDGFVNAKVDSESMWRKQEYKLATCKARCVTGFLFLMATASGCQWHVWAHKETHCSRFFAYLFCNSPFNKTFSWLMDSISVMMFKPRRGSCSRARRWNHHEGMETLFNCADVIPPPMQEILKRC